MKPLYVDPNKDIFLNQFIELIKSKNQMSIQEIINFYDSIGYKITDRTIRLMRSNINRKEGTKNFIVYVSGKGYIWIDKRNIEKSRKDMYSHMHFFVRQARDMFKEYEAARKFAFNNLDYEVQTFEELIKEIK